MSKTISTSVAGPVVLAPATDNPLYITNTGTVTSTGTADGVDGGTGTTWTISNAGVVSAASGNGVSLASSGIVSNTGSISGHDALVLHAGGSVTNNVGGSISGLGALGAGLASGAGVYITGAAGTVTNLSAISGVAYGVGFGAGGLVTNTSAITGGEDGVIIQGAIGTISNSGNITGTVDDGVALFAGGSVTNNVGGSISGQGTLGAGVFITGGVATVTNAGSIAGPNHHAVLIADGGSLTNEASGVISAVGVGVFFEIQAGTLTNAGQITATGTDGTGVYLENGGSVTNSSTGTITGHKFGVFLEGGFTTLANYGSISGATYDGVVLGLGGTVTNAAGASISGANVGVYVKYRAAGTVTNSGNISASGTGSAGVDLADGGNVTNNSAGSISGNSFGVFITGAAGAVANTGSITSVKYGGVELVKGGSVTNGVGGSIAGGSAGVYVGTAASGTVINSGNIHAANATGAGVDLSHGGSVTNNAGGSILGGGFGVFTTGAIATVSNSGSISGSHGVGLEAGGSITNNSGGSISGQVDGIFAQGGTATLTNAGSVTATAGAGADIEAGGSVTNLTGGIISGTSVGVFISGAAGTVTNDAAASISGQVAGVLGQGFLLTLTNAGSISATAGAGVDLEAGGSVTNLAGATISGSTSGIFVNGGSGTVTNSGTISGGSYAVDFAGSGTNRLVVDPGAVFNGKVTGGTGTSTLELASGTSSISGVGTGAFDNFKILAIDVGATWTFNGANAALTVLDNGTLNIAGSLVVSTAIDASSTGQLQLGSGATLDVAAATGSTTQINFQGSSSELIVDNAALFGTNVGSASYTGPQLEHFVSGDKIDLKNFSLAGVTFNYNASTGVLQVSNSAHQVADFDFQTSSLPPGTTFSATSDGGNGIVITDTSPVITVIEAFGSTKLDQVGANYFLDPVGGGTGPELIFGGAALTAGQFGSGWTILGAEAVTGGYDVAWKNTATGLYNIWSVDSNGNYIRDLLVGAAPTSSALESFETIFHQDINGDGTIGVVATTIEAFGSTSLVQVANNYFLDPVGGGTGPELIFGGAALTAGQFGSGWTILGAEAVTGGYDVAWKNTATGLYNIWSVDSNGNYIKDLLVGAAPTSSALESFETIFHQDINGDGTIGVVATTIEAFGSTSLVQVANNYFFDPVGGGTGPELIFGGAALTAGQFGSGWTILGAEAVTGGYDVAWKNTATGLYNIWSVDSNGNYIKDLLVGAAPTSTALESFETIFHQDLNGDGTIGVVTTTIEAFGSTSLVQVANNYFLDPVGGGTGPELIFGGAALTAGQFGSGWTILGAEAVTGGYDVAWKNTATGLYNIWSVDSNGNYIKDLLVGAAPTSSALESFETIFHQDLNGDGTIGLVTTTIEAFGSTSLVQVANNYFLDPVGGGTGPELKFGGATLTAGQFGSGWTILGAEATTGGYDVAWKNTATGLYNIWSVDSNGNYIKDLLVGAAPTSSALESFETIFHQDLNGDGTIGVVATTIEAFGSSSLVQVANNYFLDPVGGGTGPELKFGGAALTAGQFGSGWTILGAEAVTGGYDVAWMNTATGLYNIWSTDSNGNYIKDLLVGAAPTSSALESFETIFHQDLNGDGTIGVVATTIEAFGSSSLVQVANNYFLDPVGGGTGPELKFGGAALTAGQFGSGWTILGAEAVTGGYDVAWMNTATGLYNIWSTDSNGNYIKDLLVGAAPTSSALESFETIFHQDLNGDGVIGIPAAAAFAGVQSVSVQSGSATFDGTTLVLNTPATFNGQIIGFTGNGTLSGSDQIDLRGFNFSTVHSSFDSSSDTLSVGDGSTTASLQFLGRYSQDNFHFADDGSGGTLVVAAASPGQNAGASQVSNLAAQDTFVFAPNFGQLTLTNFAPATDTLDFSKSVFANINALVAATHDDASGNAVITDAAHDTITLLHVTTAQVLAHQSDFHLA